MQPKMLLVPLGILAFLTCFDLAQAKNYPIIAYGTRTFVAETTKNNGTSLVRVYRQMGSNTWQCYGGFTGPSAAFQARRAKVRRDPQSASAPERVYFTGRVIGSTPFQPSSPLYRYRPFKSR